MVFDLKTRDIPIPISEHGLDFGICAQRLHSNQYWYFVGVIKLDLLQMYSAFYTLIPIEGIDWYTFKNSIYL